MVPGGSCWMVQPTWRCQRSETDEALVPASLLTSMSGTGVSPAYDLVISGGSLGGAALALAMAGYGARVLVLERETRFGERLRGECLVPWGVAEARSLGIDRPLHGSGSVRTVGL